MHDTPGIYNRTHLPEKLDSFSYETWRYYDMLWVEKPRVRGKLIPILKPDNALEQLHIDRISLYVMKRGSTLSMNSQAVLQSGGDRGVTGGCIS